MILVWISDFDFSLFRSAARLPDGLSWVNESTLALIENIRNRGSLYVLDPTKVLFYPRFNNCTLDGPIHHWKRTQLNSYSWGHHYTTAKMRFQDVMISNKHMTVQWGIKEIKAYIGTFSWVYLYSLSARLLRSLSSTPPDETCWSNFLLHLLLDYCHLVR